MNDACIPVVTGHLLPLRVFGLLTDLSLRPKPHGMPAHNPSHGSHGIRRRSSWTLALLHLIFSCKFIHIEYRGILLIETKQKIVSLPCANLSKVLRFPSAYRKHPQTSDHNSVSVTFPLDSSYFRPLSSF